MHHNLWIKYFIQNIHMKTKTLASYVGLLFLVIGMTGCSSPAYNYRAESKRVSMPALNTETTAQVGDEMLKQGKFHERAAIHLSQEIKFGMFNFYTLSPGDYVKTGETTGWEFFEPAEGRGGGTVSKAA